MIFPLSIDTPLTRAALAHATKAHEGDTRNDKVTPYITHCIEVAKRALELFDAAPLRSSFIEAMRFRELLVAVALLHDVAEDHPEITEEKSLKTMGLEGFGDEYWRVLISLRILNRTDKTYLEYILSLKEDHMARLVKLADLSHNLETTLEGSRREKYRLAQYILRTHVDE